MTLPGFVAEIPEAHGRRWPADEGRVFGAAQGGPLRRSNLRRRVWKPAVEASVGDPLRVHDLRPSHAALLIGEGVHPKVIQMRLGHSSITVTLDT